MLVLITLSLEAAARLLLISARFSFPLYYELKLVGLVWLMAPQTKGAQLIYDSFINPFLTQHAAKFDPIFSTTKLVSQTLLDLWHTDRPASRLGSNCVFLAAFLSDQPYHTLTCGCLLLQAIDNAQVDKLVALAQQYGPEITRSAINQVGHRSDMWCVQQPLPCMFALMNICLGRLLGLLHTMHYAHMSRQW